MFVPKDLGKYWTNMFLCYRKLLICPGKAYNHFGVGYLQPPKRNRLAMLSKLYLNVTGIIISSLKSEKKKCVNYQKAVKNKHMKV